MLSFVVESIRDNSVGWNFWKSESFLQVPRWGRKIFGCGNTTILLSFKLVYY
jgi:hypothetical protein